MEERLKLLIEERDLTNLRLAELNYVINGYENTIKAQKEESEKDKSEKQENEEQNA